MRYPANTKSEILNPKQIQISKFQIFKYYNFRFRYCLVFGNSILEISSNNKVQGSIHCAVHVIRV